MQIQAVSVNPLVDDVYMEVKTQYAFYSKKYMNIIAGGKKIIPYSCSP
jgi:hypothetical protein